jgi:hypothetical protein
MNSVNPTLTSAEFHMAETGTGGTCVPVASPPASAPQECTISMTASLSGLGIKSGAGLYSISGLTAYQFATEQQAPGTDASIGFSDQADVAAPFDDNGTGTTT